MIDWINDKIEDSRRRKIRDRAISIATKLIALGYEPVIAYHFVDLLQSLQEQSENCLDYLDCDPTAGGVQNCFATILRKLDVFNVVLSESTDVEIITPIAALFAPTMPEGK